MKKIIASTLSLSLIFSMADPRALYAASPHTFTRGESHQVDGVRVNVPSIGAVPRQLAFPWFQEISADRVSDVITKSKIGDNFPPPLPESRKLVLDVNNALTEDSKKDSLPKLEPGNGGAAVVNENNDGDKPGDTQNIFKDKAAGPQINFDGQEKKPQSDSPVEVKKGVSADRVPASISLVPPADKGSASQQAEPKIDSAKSTRIVVGPRTFQVGREDFNEIHEKLKNIDGGERNLVQAAYMPMEPFAINYALNSKANPHFRDISQMEPEELDQYLKESARRQKELEAALPSIMKEHFLDTLQEHAHKVEKHDGFDVYEIDRGIEFWAKLISSPVAEKRIAGLVFLHGFPRRMNGDYASKFVNGLVSDLKNTTHVIGVDRLSPAEVEAAKDLAQKYHGKVSRHGPYFILGQGMSFFIMDQIAIAFRGLKKAALAARFHRVLRYLAESGLDIILDSHQGAAAYFTPVLEYLAFVMPSRSDLNTMAHEVNHARFQHFTNTLTGWLRKKKYAMPFEVDGPGMGLFSRFGAFLTLFNELNSWRIGESFDGKHSDRNILNILRRGYGPEAGWENVQLFKNFWTPQKINGKSVPRIILDQVRQLNDLDDAGMKSLGDEAVLTKDSLKAHNFMRLVQVRSDIKNLSPEIKSILQGLKQFDDENVAWIATSLLGEERPRTDLKEKTSDADFDRLADPFYPRDSKEKILARVLTAAMHEDGPKTAKHQKKALELLDRLFKEWKFEDIDEQDMLGRINRQAAGKSFEASKNRPVQKDHLFFSKSIDELLARGMFNGRNSVHRLALVNMIRNKTYPQELPKLYRMVLEVITDDNEGKPAKKDQWLARMFLIPDRALFRAHVAWGNDVAEAIRKDRTPSASALEFAGEYYRNYFAPSLGETWGEFTSGRLDRQMRQKTAQKMWELTPNQKEHYRRALSHLWFMLGHKDPKVRTSARFAIAGFPGYMMGLEDRILAVLSAKKSQRRMEVVMLVSMAEKGFMPKVDDLLDNYFKPTPQEEHYLGLRREPDDNKAWQ